MKAKGPSASNLLDTTGGVGDGPLNANTRVEELEQLVSSLRSLLEVSRQREKRLVTALEASGGESSVSLDLESNVAACVVDSSGSSDVDVLKEGSYLASLLDRTRWLAGLLVFQSCSSFILSANEDLLKAHPSIIYFLTALVGAGGNAGNQAAVRVIRGLAIGTLNDKNTSSFLLLEFANAFVISFALGSVGAVRALLSPCSLAETLAIVISLMLIVFVSILCGSMLPLFLKWLRFDPAHASTSIQVIMDIGGVMMTCLISTSLLETPWGKQITTW